MDFFDMGALDIRSEAEKFGKSGQLKMVSVRINQDYADFLNHVSSAVGMNRQPFLSAIIENYAVDAVADYIFGYSSYISVKPKNARDMIGTFFNDLPDNEQTKKFILAVEKRIDYLLLSNKVFNDYDGKDKQKFYKKYGNDLLGVK